MAKFTTDEQAREAYRTLLYNDDISTDELLAIYEGFGGLNEFQHHKPKHSQNFSFLRCAIIGNKGFPTKDYLQLFEAIDKMDKWEIIAFAQHPAVVTNDRLFKSLWERNKSSTFEGVLDRISGLHVATKSWGEAWSSLPKVHDERCVTFKDNLHYGCYSTRVVDGVKLVGFFKEFQRKVLAEFDPAILKFIQAEALSLSERLRAEYARSVLVADDHWRALANDKRSVLNNLVANALLPEDLAYEIIAAHKTPVIRESIARATASPELLEHIWSNTKSKSIRAAVAKNVVSRRYITNPEYLGRMD